MSKWKSDLPKITVEMVARAEAAAKAVAERIEQDAKNRVPVNTGRLRNAIHTENVEGGYEVIGGNTEAFYGHIVEHGGVHTPARPFMVPASEAARAQAQAMAMAIMKGLG